MCEQWYFVNGRVSKWKDFSTSDLYSLMLGRAKDYCTFYDGQNPKWSLPWTQNYSDFIDALNAGHPVEIELHQFPWGQMITRSLAV